MHTCRSKCAIERLKFNKLKFVIFNSKLFLLWILCYKLQHDKYYLDFNWCVKNDWIYRCRIMLKKGDLFKECDFDQCLHHKIQEAIIVRTLEQLLYWFSFCNPDTELNIPVGSRYIDYQYCVSRWEKTGTKPANLNAPFTKCSL